jgi:hypothetical protein
MYLPGFDSPEFWGFGAGTLVLLVGLVYGAVRAGWLSRRERARVDDATIEAQRREDTNGQQGSTSHGGWWQGGGHTVPDPNTRGV